MIILRPPAPATRFLTAYLATLPSTYHHHNQYSYPVVCRAWSTFHDVATIPPTHRALPVMRPRAAVRGSSGGDGMVRLFARLNVRTNVATGISDDDGSVSHAPKNEDGTDGDDVEEGTNRKPNTRGRPIEMVCRKSGKTLRSFASGYQAGKELRLSSNRIYNVLRGKAKSYKGYEWRYQDTHETENNDLTHADTLPPAPRFCYLLSSKNPRYPHKTYIGVSKDPHNRLEQHNGSKPGGAKKTRIGRPWELVLVLQGFSSDRDALRFEWIWQHFGTSTVVRRVIGDKEARRTMRRSRKSLEGRFEALGMLLKVFPDFYGGCQKERIPTVFLKDADLMAMLGCGEGAREGEGEGNGLSLVCGIPPSFVVKKETIV